MPVADGAHAHRVGRHAGAAEKSGVREVSIGEEGEGWAELFGFAVME